LHAEVAGALDDMLQEKQIVPMGSLDRHLETRLQGCGAGDVIDMAMGQPDLVDCDIGLSDRALDVRRSPPGSMTTPRLVASHHSRVQFC